MRWALAGLVIVGCSTERVLDVPSLGGARAALLARPGVPRLEAFDLDAGGIRFDVDADAEALVELLLYDAPLAELPLGSLELTSDPTGDLLVPPDRVLALDEGRSWRAGDLAAWAERRTSPPRCSELDVRTLELGAHGSTFELVRYDEARALARTEDAIFLVTKDRAERLAYAPPHAGDRRGALAVDERGHVFQAYGARVASSATVASPRALTIVELDASFALVREHTVLSDEIDDDKLGVHALAVGEGEMFMLLEASLERRIPSVHRWTVGAPTLTRLPWPSAGEGTSACSNVGQLRVYLERTGPNRASFLYRQSAIAHWDGARFTTERIVGGVCDGIVSDGRLEDDSLALVRFEAAVGVPEQVLSRDRGAWISHSVGATEINSLGLARLDDRFFATASAGRLVEIIRRRSGGLIVCDPVAIQRGGDRSSVVLRVGEELLVGVAAEPGGPTQLHWVRPR